MKSLVEKEHDIQVKTTSINLLKDKESFDLNTTIFDLAVHFSYYGENEEFEKNPLRFVKLNFV